MTEKFKPDQTPNPSTTVVPKIVWPLVNSFEQYTHIHTHVYMCIFKTNYKNYCNIIHYETYSKLYAKNIKVNIIKVPIHFLILQYCFTCFLRRWSPFHFGNQGYKPCHTKREYAIEELTGLGISASICSSKPLWREAWLDLHVFNITHILRVTRAFHCVYAPVVWHLPLALISKRELI